MLINSISGLSNNKVNTIFQDSRGFIWFGTDDGLNRFDGYEYVVFRHGIYDSLSIASGLIHAITEDAEGNMWIATDKGVSKFDLTANLFYNLSFYPVSLSINVNETYDITFGRDGILWCLMNETILGYNIYTGRVREYHLSGNGEEAGISERSKLFYDRRHDVLLIGTSTGLRYLDEQTGRVQATPLKTSFIYDIFLDREGELWLGSTIGLSKCTWEPGNGVPADCEQVISGRPVRAIAQLPGQQIVVATRNSTMLFDKRSGEVVASPYVMLNGTPEIPSVRDIVLDGSMNLWIGTYGGVCKIDLHPYRFSYFNAGSEPVSLDMEMISSVYADEDKVYLGSWGGGLQVIDQATGTKKFFTRNDPGTKFGESGVNVIKKDLKGRIWVMSQNAYLFDPASETFSKVEEQLDIPGISTLSGSRIYDMAVIDSNAVIITHRNGYYYINESSHRFRDVRHLLSDTGQIPLDEVTAVEYNDGILWLGTSSGLIWHDLSTGESKFYQVGIDKGMKDKVLTMKLDSRGWLWLGSPSGLYRLNGQSGTFSGYSVHLGFANDYIYSIEEDDEGRLWLGTNQGIISLDPVSMEVMNYGIQHGLSCMEFNINASFFSEKGTMYFGGISGVNYFVPDSVTRTVSIPPTRITGMRYFSNEGAYYNPFVPDKLTIRDDESIQLFFSLLDFNAPDYKRFSYRLSDANGPGRWHDIGSDNSLILSGLNHGNYTFEVVGSDNDRQLSIQPGTIELQVIAPIYRRNIFVFMMFLPLLLLVYFLFEYRTKTLKKSNRALREKEIAAKEVLRQKNLLSSRNKNIEDSLKYAQRIQYAMFTSELEIKKMFPESFIFQKPKDIVSGDFYWARKKSNKVFLAAVDCTGHGVPGAFMSLIGLEFFRQIIDTQGVTKPSQVLNEINRNFDLIFDNLDDLNMRDGMDLAFCTIDTHTNKLQFAGAFNPIYIIRNGEIIEIKGDKHLLGPDLGYGRSTFTNHEFQLEKEDILYMFSDGYADQFGGPEGRKFKYRRFRHLLLSIYRHPVDLQKNILENSINDWKGDFEQVDDILVMGVKPFI